MTSKRLISFEDVNNAFRTMTSEGGRFHDLMAKQAKTFPGLMSNFLIFLQLISREVGHELIPTSIEYLKVLTEWIKTNKQMLKDNIVSFYKGFLDILQKMAIFIRDMIPKVLSLVESLGGMGRILKSIGIALAVILGIQIANMIGTMILGIGSFIALLAGALTGALALDLALGFLPILIGLAVIALGLLVDEFVSFFNGQDTAIGRLMDRWKDWKRIIGDVLDLVSLLNPLTLLAQVGSLATTGHTLGTNFAGLLGKIEAANTNSQLPSIIQNAGTTSSFGASGNTSGSTTVLNQKVQIDVNGAADTALVANTVYNKLEATTYNSLMNNSSSSMATSSTGNP